jgi:hypothetical protein
MSLDVHQMCAVCAWRENCKKKHTMREGVLHCADFTRDKTLPAEEETKPKAACGHKKIVDPFA